VLFLYKIWANCKNMQTSKRRKWRKQKINQMSSKRDLEENSSKKKAYQQQEQQNNKEFISKRNKSLLLIWSTQQKKKTTKQKQRWNRKNAVFQKEYSMKKQRTKRLRRGWFQNHLEGCYATEINFVLFVSSFSCITSCYKANSISQDIPRYFPSKGINVNLIRRT